MAGVVNEVTIKKEIEDPPESPDQGDTQDSNQSLEQNSQKSSKVWCEDEVRSLIALAKHYIPNFKDSSYSKRQLLEDISNELRMIGYDTTPENVRNKMKYLRTRYKGFIDHNAKNAEKRTMQFSDELTELYSLDYFEGHNNSSDLLNGNGTSDIFYTPTPPSRSQKRTKSVPASHVDLRTVVTSKKRNGISPKQSRLAAKKRNTGKPRSQPLFQCGLCMQKFSTSFDMHGHACKPTPKVTETNKKKVNNSQLSSTPTVFHWNSLITMHFLELLREYQLSSKNSNFRKGNIWENMSLLMKRKGHTIQPKELEKKFNVLTTAFEKTMKYNKTHKDKKKCAFFKRLTELSKHPSSFDCFKAEEPVKMTVEVSPFSFAASRDTSAAPTRSSSSSNPTNQRKSNADIKVTPPAQNGSHELLQWLQNSWNEWKEMEKKKEEIMAQRHNELMEMLSYLIDSSADSNAH